MWLPGLAPPGPRSDDHDGAGDEWYTPPEVVRAVRELTHDGVIDLDPCYAPGCLTDARHRIDVRQGGDGLRDLWPGACCCNPQRVAVGLQHEHDHMHEMQRDKAGDDRTLRQQSAQDERSRFVVPRVSPCSSSENNGREASGPKMVGDSEGAAASLRLIREAARCEAQGLDSEELCDQTITVGEGAWKEHGVQVDVGTLGVGSADVGQQVLLLPGRQAAGAGPLHPAVEPTLPWNDPEQYGSGLCPVQPIEGVADAAGLAVRQARTICANCGAPFYGGLVFVNPPFANVGPWLERCHRESAARPVVAMVPMRPETRAWWSHVWGAGGYVVVQRGRVRFVGTTGERHGNGMLTTCFLTWREGLAQSLAEALTRRGVDAVALRMVEALPW